MLSAIAGIQLINLFGPYSRALNAQNAELSLYMRRIQKKLPGLAYVKAMAKINDRDVLPDVKLPKKRKKRAKETFPRKQPEAEFRQDVYRFLRKDKRIVDYKRIENGVSGKHGRGVPDFMFWTRTGFYWLELKAQGNDLDEYQRDFKDNCLRTGVNHITAWTIEDIERELEP